MNTLNILRREGYILRGLEGLVRVDNKLLYIRNICGPYIQHISRLYITAWWVWAYSVIAVAEIQMVLAYLVKFGV